MKVDKMRLPVLISRRCASRMLSSVAIRLEVMQKNHKTLKSAQFPSREANWTLSEQKLLLHQTDRSIRLAGL